MKIKKLFVKIFKFKHYFLYLTIVFAGLIYFSSCENNPGDMGLEFILSDTLNTKVIDSNTDSMAITSYVYQKGVNSSASPYLLVGKQGQYESKALLKFLSLPNNYAGATVLSARIKLNYAKYAYLDSNATVAFDFYKINNDYNFSNINADSISSSSFGNVSLGNYSGNPTDTGAFSIPFDNTTAKNWLEYAADNNYAEKNYGIALIANSSSSVIKGFGSIYNNNVNLYPELIIIATKNNVTDTIISRVSVNTNIITGTLPSQPDRIVIQNGIAFFTALNFNLNKLPNNVTVNEVILTLTLDTNNSFIGNAPNKTIYFSMFSDSVAKTIAAPDLASNFNGAIYTVNLTPIIQRWNLNHMPNYGILMQNIFLGVNLDKFVFYGQGIPDINLRPKLKIRYTPRG